MDAYTGSSEEQLHEKIKRHITRSGGGADVTSGDVGEGRSGRIAAASQGDGGGDKVSAAEALIEAFSSHVDVARLLSDMRAYSRSLSLPASDGNSSSDAIPGGVGAIVGSSTSSRPASNLGRDGRDAEKLTAAATAAIDVGAGSDIGHDEEPAARMGRVGGDRSLERGAVGEGSRRKTREEVEAEAAKQGASGG